MKPVNITCFHSSVSGSCPQNLSDMIVLVPLNCLFLGETSEKYFLALLSSSNTDLAWNMEYMGSLPLNSQSAAALACVSFSSVGLKF